LDAENVPENDKDDVDWDDESDNLSEKSGEEGEEARIKMIDYGQAVGHWQQSWIWTC
jgi:hypothetical protein